MAGKGPPPLPPRPDDRPALRRDEIVPPAVARDVDTEPGLGMTAGEMQLRRDLARIRRERDRLRDEALVSSASGSVPPPTRRQRNVRVSLALGKYAGLLLLLPALGAAVAKRWPDYADIVNVVISVLGQ